jgi:hypothetical protein
MSKVLKACKTEWDQVRGYHQSQRSKHGRANRPDTKLHPTSRQIIKPSLAMREPSTQDIPSITTVPARLNARCDRERCARRSHLIVAERWEKLAADAEASIESPK